MTANTVRKAAHNETSTVAGVKGRIQNLSYFALAVLGFSFWFLMAVPFASHRESYMWLAMVNRQSFADLLGFTATTFRPFAQAATWLGFLILDPTIFPTSLARQALLQGFVWGMFVMAWCFIYSAAPQRRLFAIISLLTGGVFFSGYVHLFHIYGVFYIPIMFTLAAVLRFRLARYPERKEVLFAVVATLLVLWHPFATAIFLGFYFGWCLQNFRERNRKQNVQSVLILVVGTFAIAALLLPSPRVETMTLSQRLFGFLVSYRTNEINIIASLIAWLLAHVTVLSLPLSYRLKLLASSLLAVVAFVLVLTNVPVLLLWLAATLAKVFYLRIWSLFFAMLAATLLPLGGGIGTPIYGLFAIVLAVFITPFGWSSLESSLSVFKARYVTALVLGLLTVASAVRAGVEVPIVSQQAKPLLAERERTYQLEQILAWLGNSEYCACDIAFAESAGDPIDSVESAITRRFRPPAGLKDVRNFWNNVLKCSENRGERDGRAVAIVTFGGPELTGVKPVFKVRGNYGGDATVWVDRFEAN